MAASGAWVTLDSDRAVDSIHSAELAALRRAVEIKGTIVHWPFGATRDKVEGAR